MLQFYDFLEKAVLGHIFPILHPVNSFNFVTKYDGVTYYRTVLFGKLSSDTNCPD